ncbi:ubiquinol-cytochrome c reductase iron-sulfur subunit [Thermodesulfobacteriota bacterium]
MKQEENNLNRRAFIQTAALTGCATILVGIPIASYVLAPAAQKGTGKWIDFGSVDDLEQDDFSMLSYEFMIKDGWQVLPQRGFVWARKDISAKIKVFSSTCSHLACNVIWREDKQVFECPCHSGQFNPEGHPIAGPPSKPLSSLDHKIEDGNLLVYLSF